MSSCVNLTGKMVKSSCYDLAMFIGVQVNPESADEVEMDSMWSRIGGNRGESILDDKTVRLTLPAE